MPAIDSNIPARETYRFVLRRYDRAPNRSIRFQGYNEVVKSKAIAMNGVIAQTCFVRSQHVAKRMCKLGWLNETAKWDEYLRPELDPDHEAIYLTLKASGPLAKAEIIKATKLDPSTVRRGLDELRGVGLVEKIGENRDTKYGALTADADD